MHKDVKQICKDIKELNIQGARNIALFGLKAFVIEGTTTNKMTRGTYLTHLKKTSDFIKVQRTTEPMLINLLDQALLHLHDLITIKEMKQYLIRFNKQTKINFQNNIKKMAQVGAKLIKNGDTILTICHSSSAVAVLIEAKKQGKKFKVYACETRPRWQGHLTVKDLAKHKIDVTLMVDSATGTFMPNVNKVFVGGDAVNYKGDLVNKIGTKMVAFMAKHEKAKFYPCVELLKLDSRKKIPIEERNQLEVANPKRFKGVKIVNPAFDLIPHEYITKYVTEIGLVIPTKFHSVSIRQFK